MQALLAVRKLLWKRKETALQAEVGRLSAQLKACTEELGRLKARRWHTFQPAVGQAGEVRLLRSALAGRNCEAPWLGETAR